MVIKMINIDDKNLVNIYLNEQVENRLQDYGYFENKYFNLFNCLI